MPIRPRSPRSSTSRPEGLAIEVVNVNEPTEGWGCAQATNFQPCWCVKLSFPMAKPGSAGRAEQIRAGASSAEGAASTGPERTRVREDRSASGNARMSRPSSEDARADRRIQASTLAQKLWDAHVVRSAEGEPDLLFVDLHLVHEVTSPQAFEGFRLAGRQVPRPGPSGASRDHKLPPRAGV